MKVKMKLLNRVQLFATPTRLLCPWDSPGKEYWSRVPFLSPGDLPDPGIEPQSPTLEADALTSEPPGKP